MRKTIRSGAETLIFKAFARHFVAGERIQDAIARTRLLNVEGKRATINYLGEHAKTEDQVIANMREYITLVQEIAANRLDASISIKLTQLGLTFDEALCRACLSSILQEAHAKNVRVEFDMENVPHNEKIVQMFLLMRSTYHDIRLALQAYLYKTERDIPRLNKAAAMVRLCKGAYDESPHDSIRNDFEVRMRFLLLTAELMNNGFHPAIATHDRDIIRMIRKRYGKQKGRFEFQMLMGIERRLQTELKQSGYAVRIYVPYGPDWLAYGMRRVKFFLKHPRVFAESIPLLI